MDPRSHVRGRQVRARLLVASVAAAAALVLAPQAPGAPTGRLLVLLEPSEAPRASAAAVLARAGARPAGPRVPQIGLLTVRAAPGVAAALRADPAVASVQAEGRMTLRATANDPALTRAETASGTPPGTPQQWPAARQRFDRAWDFTTGAGALVGVIDTGVDGAHREFAGKVAAAVDQDSASSTPGTDEEGHGTHVASLACAATNNAVGIAGAGRDCRLIVEKTDLTDASIAASIVDAANRGAHAINMSFGDEGNRPPVQALVAAIDYARARNVVLVAAARDDQRQEDQGQPANLLQPTGTGPSAAPTRGLTVTASSFQDRNPGTGAGSQISMAAAGAFASFDDTASPGPPGLLGVAPAGRARRLDGDVTAVPPVFACGCRTSSEGATFAYLQGTSMAAPQVTAIAALMRALNPDATAPDVVRMLKATARRPAGAWTPQLGWGILDAGAALEAAATLDRRAPASRARASTTLTRLRRFRVRWTASDPAPSGLRPSGVRLVELWRATGRGRYRLVGRYARNRSALVSGAPGVRYSFMTVAVDRAGNREARPSRADVSVRVRPRPR